MLSPCYVWKMEPDVVLAKVTNCPTQLPEGEEKAFSLQT